MTHEQFYYWLRGAMDTRKQFNHDSVNIYSIEEKMKEVKEPVRYNYMLFTSTDLQLNPITNPTATYDSSGGVK